MRLPGLFVAFCLSFAALAATAAPAVPKHASTISGTVTRAADASPVVNVPVLVLTTVGDFVAFSRTSPTGAYSVDPGPGTFVVAVIAPRLVTEIYNNLSCPVLACDLALATPIVLVHGGAISDIDFVLDPQPRIAGTVTGGSPPVPQVDVNVSAIVATGDAAGTSAGEAVTLADGSYELFFDPSSVRVQTSNTAQLIDVVHPNIPCPFGSCDPTGASVFTLATGQTQAGVNFVLAPGASLGGEITRASDGQPIAFVQVDVHGTTGAVVAGDTSQTDGSWRIRTGMPAGTYRAVARDSGTFQAEVWDDQPCIGPPGDECDIAAGDPIVLGATQQRNDIDFALSRSSGTLSGTVTQFGTGAPLVGVLVEVLANNLFVASAQSGVGGSWSIELAPGNYAVRATPTPPLAEEWYPNVQCAGGFFACVGEPDIVTLATEQEIDDIDFALAPIATLSVVARNADTGVEIPATWLAALPGVVERAQGASQPGVAVQFPVLGGGAVRIAGQSATCGPSNNQVCLAERFPDDPCPALACDLAIGTAINVPKGATVGGIEIVLGVGATIAGTLTATAGGAPVVGAFVEAFDVNRVPIANAQTDVDGTYELRGLGTGPYFAYVEPPSPLLAELYDNVSCPDRSCALASGTTIATTPGTTTPGIDFALSAGGTIAGTVASDLVSTLEGATITVFNASGTQVAEAVSDSSGSYVSPGLLAGNYFVRFTKPGFDAVLFAGLPCPGATCNPTTGSVVVVTAGQPTTGINAVLPDTGQPGPAQLVYLNRCTGGCVVRSGFESSINNTSSIVSGTRTLDAYAWGDASFAAFTQCVRETFAPYQITITTNDPGNVPHREHIVAGTPGQAGFSNGVSGVSPFSCGSIPNSISFTFANVIGDDIHELCWTAAQEIAHGFGLDHEVNPPDPMSYIDAPTKRFTPDTAPCGEFAARACACGGTTQNSNALLLRAVGGNPNLFRDGFEDAAATINRNWKDYQSPFPKREDATSLSCGTDPIEAMKAR